MADLIISSDMDAFLATANDAAARAELGLAIGTNVQAYDADLTTWAGITPGTGVGTALAVNVGSAGAFVVLGGAAGTPSSITLTNGTGLPQAGVTGLTTADSPQFAGVNVGHASDTTVTRLAAGLIGVEGAVVPVNVTKVTSGNYTIGTTDARELYGGTIYVTGAATITIPAVAAGASFTVITIGAVAVSVDPNASDLIYLDGTALSDGDKITNLSTAGDIAVFSYFDATGWYASTNGWTDGN